MKLRNVINGVSISTVDLMEIPHRGPDGTLSYYYETLIGYEDEDKILRYKTHEEAVEGHKNQCRLLSQ